MQPRDDDALLTPSEVAAMFRVNPKTVTRWARAGKISAIRTLGGHRRFRDEPQDQRAHGDAQLGAGQIEREPMQHPLDCFGR